jgi:hypothetical protein
MVNTEYLSLITGAYLSGKGYLVEIQPEALQNGLRPDFIAVKPIIREQQRRLDKGAAPVGILYLLDKKGWIITEHIIQQSGYREDFVWPVLRDAEKEGWVKSKNEAGGQVSWIINNYSVPVKECLYLCCGIEDPLGAVNVLKSLKGSYHKGYIVFTYRIDDKFLHDCRHEEIGVLIYDEKSSGFREPLKAHRLKITDKKTYYSISERIVVNRCLC